MLKLYKYLVSTWASFLVPFYFEQEEYIRGTQVLAVWRFGKKSWELYGWDWRFTEKDLKNHFEPLKIGTSEYYHRLQLSVGNFCEYFGAYSGLDVNKYSTYEEWSYGQEGRVHKLYWENFIKNNGYLNE